MKKLNIFLVIIFLFQSCNYKNKKIEDINVNSKRIILFNDAKIIGDTIFKYYANGNIKTMLIKDTIRNKKEIYDYYTNGIIKTYNIARYIEEKEINDIFFIRRYNEDNKSIIDTGTVVGLITNKEDKLLKKDTLYFDILVAKPPNCMYYLLAGVTGFKEKELKVNNNIAKFWFISDTAGIYKLNIEYALKDTLRDTVTTSNVFLNLKVY